MITSAFLHVFSSALYLIFSMLPTVTEAPDWFGTYIEPTLPVFSALNNIPIISTAIGIFMVAMPFIIGWQVVLFSGWVYNKMRGS